MLSGRRTQFDADTCIHSERVSGLLLSILASQSNDGSGTSTARNKAHCWPLNRSCHRRLGGSSPKSCNQPGSFLIFGGGCSDGGWVCVCVGGVPVALSASSLLLSLSLRVLRRCFCRLSSCRSALECYVGACIVSPLLSLRPRVLRGRLCQPVELVLGNPLSNVV